MSLIKDVTSAGIPIQNIDNAAELKNATDEMASKVAATKNLLDEVNVASKIPQVEIKFFQPIIDQNAIETLTGGGIPVTQINGLGIISCDTSVTGNAKLQSANTIKYIPGKEIFYESTASFTIPTHTNSNQRIGLFDNDNGFFIGYKGLEFGITHRRASIEVAFISKNNFNTDLLDGNSKSKFKSNNIPIVLNPSFLNAYRIRFGWFGAIPILFEVYSPDGGWVIFHTIRYPNTSNIPHIQTPDLPLTWEVTKTNADNTNLSISTCSAICGITGAQLDGIQTISTTQLPSTLSGSGNLKVEISQVTATNIGTVNQGLSGVSPWLVKETTIENALDVTLSSRVASTQIPTTLVNGRLDVNIGESTALDISDRSNRIIGHVNCDNFPMIQTISGIVTSNIGTSGGLATNSHLDDKFGNLGQAIMATSAPVVIASDQTSIPVNVNNLPSIQQIYGTVTANLGTIGTIVTNANLDQKFGNLGQKISDGSAPIVIASDQSTIPVNVSNFPNPQIISGTVTATQGLSGTSAWKIDGSSFTQPISAAALPLPLNASTSSLQTTSNTSLASIDIKTPPLGQTTMANSQPIVIASNQSAIAITASSLPLPNNASTESTLSLKLNEATFTSRINTQGQKTMAGSTPVVLASDQSTLKTDSSAVTQPISGTITAIQGSPGSTAWKTDGSATTQPISAISLPLPINAATSALQTIGNTSLASIDAKTAPLGQTTMANSHPIVIASNQSAVTISGTVTANLGTIDGVATASQLPSTLIGGKLDTNIGSWFGSTVPTTGQKTMASSIPVVLSSDQSTIQVSSKPSAAGGFNNISINTTTTCKATAGVLRNITINTSGTGANTITVRDGATNIAIISGNTAPTTLMYNVTFNTNLTVITAASGAPNITVTFD